MKTVVASLKSVSPYSQSKHYDTDSVPLLESEPKVNADYEKRTWRNRMHSTTDGHVFIPPMAFKNAMSEAAKFLSIKIPGSGKSTYTKHVEAGILVTDPLVLPDLVSDVRGEWLFLPSDGMRGGSRRVNKCCPVIPEWSGDVTFMVLDETVTEEPFERILRGAGMFIGIGRFRPRNNGFYGRFSIERLMWS